MSDAMDGNSHSHANHEDANIRKITKLKLIKNVV